ncbi:MAG: hypothetical protein WBQ14_02165 [Gaiellaceae bacterium]
MIEPETVVEVANRDGQVWIVAGFTRIETPLGRSEVVVIMLVVTVVPVPIVVELSALAATTHPRAATSTAAIIMLSRFIAGALQTRNAMRFLSSGIFTEYLSSSKRIASSEEAPAVSAPLVA